MNYQAYRGSINSHYTFATPLQEHIVIDEKSNGHVQQTVPKAVSPSEAEFIHLKKSDGGVVAQGRDLEDCDGDFGLMQ